MARIAGVDIPREKRVEVALTYIFGIGLPTAQKILTQTNVNPDTRVRDLTEEQVNRLRELIDRRYKVEGDLRREVALNIKRLIEIGSYRGMRHRRNLPGRGQRTKTNARQRRGPKKTGGGRRKKEPEGNREQLAERNTGAQRRRRERKNVPQGHVHIQATFNNTIITITDLGGAVISWGSAGVAGLRAPARARPTRPRSPPTAPRAGRWSTACARSRSTSRD